MGTFAQTSDDVGLWKFIKINPQAHGVVSVINK